jgi:hypothetical protein
MRTFKWLACVSMLTAMTATAQVNRKVDAIETVELMTREVSMPESPTGLLQFRRCERCPVITVTGNLQTRYRIGARDVSFQEFRAAVDAPNMGFMLDYQVVSGRMVRLTAQSAGR